MTSGGFPKVIDGHEDFLRQMRRRAKQATDGRTPPPKRDFLIESSEGHVDAPRARRGGIGAAFASIFLNDEQAGADAIGFAMRELDDLFRLSDRSEGHVRIIRTVPELELCLGDDAFGTIVHFEGADPIGPDLTELRVFYEAGLRSLGIVWSRSTIFGHGVAISDDGASRLPYEGLTEVGRQLVRECNQMGILVDVSHLNVPGFWDLVEVCEKPFVATHSNALAVAGHPRNLNDDQLRALAEHDGCAGLNFYTGFLRPDRAQNPDTSLDQMLAHIDHIKRRVGARHVAIGSDYDGASPLPADADDASKLPALLHALETHGYTDAEIEGICQGNFLRVLRQVWK